MAESKDMRVGILWTDGEITMSANLDQAMRHFLNAKSVAREFHVGPAKIMMFQEDKWKPLKADHNQIRVLMKTIDEWYLTQVRKKMKK